MLLARVALGPNSKCESLSLIAGLSHIRLGEFRDSHLQALRRKGLSERRGLSQLCPASLLQKGWVYTRKAGLIPERRGSSQVCPARLLKKGWVYDRKAGLIAERRGLSQLCPATLLQKGRVYRSYEPQDPCRKGWVGSTVSSVSP